MILILTNSIDPHADFLIEQLRARSILFTRIDTDLFFNKQALAYSTTRSDLNLEQVTVIWNRRPQTPVIQTVAYQPHVHEFCAREAEAALFGQLLALDAIWVNDPYANKRAGHKVLQLNTAKQIGFSVPETLVSNDPERVIEFVTRLGECVYKPLTWGVVGTGDGSTAAIYASVIGSKQLAPESIRLCPGIYQQTIQKARELRVTCMGNELHAVSIEGSLSVGIDIRREMINLPHMLFDLDSNTTELCQRLRNSFGLLYCAIDLVQDTDGKIWFLEVNPNGQWGWIEKKTGLPLRESMIRLLTKKPH
jgi:hypothetical protein